MSQDLTDNKSTLVQVRAWCRQATSHYLSQCWPRSLSPYGAIRPQWVKWAISHTFQLLKSSAFPIRLFSPVWYKTKVGSQNFGYQLWYLFCNTAQCCNNAVNFLTNIHKRQPQVWGVFCRFSLWLIFCLKFCNYLCNILLFWTML